jgi:hypothetical protein
VLAPGPAGDGRRRWPFAWRLLWAWAIWWTTADSTPAAVRFALYSQSREPLARAVATNPAQAGSTLKEILQERLEDNCRLVVAWTGRGSRLLQAENINVRQVNGYRLTFDPRLTLRPAQAGYQYVINLRGNDYTVVGLHAEGGHQYGIDTGKSVIQCWGQRYRLEGCVASDGVPTTSGHCFNFVQSDDLTAPSTIVACEAVNPGYAGFRVEAIHIVFQGCRALFNEEATASQMGGYRFNKNRLVNVDAPQPLIPYHRVRFEDCEFLADLSPALPRNTHNPAKPWENWREVHLLIDPGDLPHQWAHRVEMVNCRIRFNDQVEANQDPHVIKVVNVKDVLFDNVTIETPEGYNGYAIRMGREFYDGRDSQDHKPNMSMTIRNCHWDQTIIFHGDTTTNDELHTDVLRIEESEIGSHTAHGRAGAVFAWEHFALAIHVSNSRLLFRPGERIALTKPSALANMPIQLDGVTYDWGSGGLRYEHVQYDPAGNDDPFGPPFPGLTGTPGLPASSPARISIAPGYRPEDVPSFGGVRGYVWDGRHWRKEQEP